jgi:hypothetical protein
MKITAGDIRFNVENSSNTNGKKPRAPASKDSLYRRVFTNIVGYLMKRSPHPLAFLATYWLTSNSTPLVPSLLGLDDEVPARAFSRVGARSSVLGTGQTFILASCLVLSLWMWRTRCPPLKQSGSLNAEGAILPCSMFPSASSFSLIFGKTLKPKHVPASHQTNL